MQLDVESQKTLDEVVDRVGTNVVNPAIQQLNQTINNALVEVGNEIHGVLIGVQDMEGKLIADLKPLLDKVDELIQESAKWRSLVARIFNVQQ